MTVSTTTTTISYLGNGVTTTFTFPFIGVSSADMEVIYTDSSGGQVTLSPSAYTIVINAPAVGQLWGIGGSVTYPISGTPIQSGTQLTINRIVPYIQPISISNQGAFYPQVVEQGLDLLELEIQQIESSQARALQVPISDPVPGLVPSVTARANGVLGFDTAGDPVIFQTGSTVSNVSAVTVVHANSPYTSTGTPNVIYADAIAGVITINLPSAVGVKQIDISKVDSTANVVTIAAAGGQTINGTSTISLDNQYQSVILVSNGTNAWTVFSNGSSSGLSVAKITSANSPYNVLSPKNVIVVSAASGSVIVNLPVATSIRSVYVCRTDNVYANSVTITANSGSGTIEGASYYLLQFQNQGVMCISDGGTNWNIFGQIKPTTNPLTPNMKIVNNIFDLINDPDIITRIQAGTYANDLDSYFTQMCSVGGTWFLPHGTYGLADTVNMPPGMELWGVGSTFDALDPTQSGTVVYLGGTAGQWGLQQSNPNSASSYEGYKLRDICFKVSYNGARWNRINGGFTDDNTSQGYMMRPRIEGCMFLLNNTAGSGIGVQMNKSFDFVIRDCNFADFSTSCDLEGSDIGVIEGCRFNNETAYAVVANSHSTFGSNLALYNNDFNDPYGFVDTTYLDILIDNNHMEFDLDKTRITAAIRVSGDAFITKIHNNRIETGGLVTNWLSVTNDPNRYLVSVFNNNDPTNPSLMGNVSYSSQNYINNASGRSIVIHGGNTNGDSSFPMNWVDGSQNTPPGYYARVTPSTAGVNLASVLNPVCSGGSFTITPNADTTKKMEISDWNSYGLPGNTMKGPVTISITTAAGAAGQIGSWEILDNSVSVSSGTITHAVSDQMYYTTLISSHTFTGPVQLKLWNADTGNGERFYIFSADFKIG